MRWRLCALAIWFCVAPLCSAVPGPSETGRNSAVESAIRKVLNQWPRDFANRNALAVCGLFAPDLIATYLGGPDRNYSAMCAELTQILQNPQKIYRYDAPQIEEIIVSGPIAVVRLTWTLRISSNSGQMLDMEKERGMDLFVRQKDGSWKIRISYAFPQKDMHG